MCVCVCVLACVFVFACVRSLYVGGNFVIKSVQFGRVFLLMASGTTFFIDVREFELVCNRTDRIACYKYGNHLPWATNLQSLFTVNVAGQSYLNRQIVFVSATISPDSVTPGLYRVQYTLQQAADYNLFIQFKGQDIPGNPFKVLPRLA